MLTYKRLHLICQKNKEGAGYIGLNSIQHPNFDYAYISGKWVLDKATAQSLLGGLIFLHEAKTKTSHFGGLIYDWEYTPDMAKPTEDRISFKFLAVADGRYVRWGGKDHVMAWQSGIVMPDEAIIIDTPTQQRHVGRGLRKLADIPEDFVLDLQARALQTYSD